MSWQDPRLWAAIWSVKGIGRITFNQVVHELRQHHLSADESWKKLHQLESLKHRSSILANYSTLKCRYSLSDYWNWLCESDIQVVTTLQSTYPSLLAEIADRPPVLFVKGPSLTKHTWGKVPIAVVGTRHITPYGTLATEKITRELVDLGATIVSGFMTGVDLTAHQTVLAAKGNTIGVLGFGFNHMYPAYLRSEVEAFLAQEQTLVTEYAPIIAPTKGTFPQRNRIVAGLTRATIVIEAAAGSGSLITASLAADYNREVFAVPGPLTSIYSRGTTQLLNQGARLVTSGREVMAELESLIDYPGVSAQLATDGLSKTIYTQLQHRPRTEVELESLCQKPLNQILATLSMMEVAGWLKQDRGRWVTVTPLAKV